MEHGLELAMLSGDLFSKALEPRNCRMKSIDTHRWFSWYHRVRVGTVDFVTISWKFDELFSVLYSTDKLYTNKIVSSFIRLIDDYCNIAIKIHIALKAI